MSSSKNIAIAVLGAGRGGKAMAADLTLRGFKVNLFDLPQFANNVSEIQERGGIEVTGALEGFAKPNKVTTNIRETIEDVGLIMITSGAMGHKAHIEACAPYLKNGQVIVVNTGYFFALRFANTLKETLKDVIMAEYTLLPYACRRIGPSIVNVGGIKQELPVAAFPAKKTEKVVGILKNVYPQTVPATNVLETSFNNLNPIFHPAITVLNTGLVEHTKGDFLFYTYGVTPTIGKIIDAIDEERRTVAKTLGLDVASAVEWEIRYYGKYGAKGNSAYEVLQSCGAYKTIKYPIESIASFSLFAEDLPYGLVPIASLGSMLNIPTPTIKTIIDLSSLLTGIDYWREGTTVEKLGMTGLNAGEIRERVTEG